MALAIIVRGSARQLAEAADLPTLTRGTVSAPRLQLAFMDKAKNTRTDKTAAHRIQGSIIAKCTS
jgi:hypothetical protein